VKLYNNLKTELIKTDLHAATLEELLVEIIHHLKMRDLVTNEKEIVNKLMERERLGSTSIGNSSAVPHTKLKDLKAPIIFIGVSRKGILYNAKDKDTVHFVILILSPNESPIVHLQILAAAASLIKKSPQLIKDTRSCETPEELLDVIRRYEMKDD
jgi:mannitol/fructose-specific phosphotransferase system IIA component (Ntr-type)